jgi:alpha-galactosidase
MMLADFYPLTPYSRQSNQWIAWQFNRPDRGDGCVQAFRRGECAESTMKVGLNGLDPAVAYELKDLDANGTAIMSGKRLMKDGLSIEVKGRPGAAIIQYRVFPHSARR